VNNKATEKVQYKKRMVSKREVVSITGLSGVTIWRRMKAGDFPLSLQLTPSKIGWFLHEIEAWVDSRPRGIAPLPANLNGGNNENV
jgi:prophage regulatory protein